MPKVFVLYYSTYGHVQTLSRHIRKGLESQGVEVETYQVPETLSEDILEKMHAPPKSDDPVITVDKLKEADGFMLGIPTRFGSMPAQWKSFLDATGQLWASGALAGKFAGIFFSTASQHGGQESTAWTTVTYLAHHGINYVPFGFANTHLFDNSEVVGGSAYGAGTVANGDGSRQPSEKELAIAETQGENFAKLLNTMHKGQTPQVNGEKKEKTSQQDKPKEAPTTTRAAAPKPAPKDDEEPKKKNKCFCM
ncbi:NAD(P)H:quinone oxidoreductase, type IV [Lichtheimia hyalospora FSU 10163]|nr:NAD(P)H:quinone oxidoreductase, type IV [Lichtheimia hyalospora FSU 10163]